jgi:hypothetical protein
MTTYTSPSLEDLEQAVLQKEHTLLARIVDAYRVDEDMPRWRPRRKQYTAVHADSAEKHYAAATAAEKLFEAHDTYSREQAYRQQNVPKMQRIIVMAITLKYGPAGADNEATYQYAKAFEQYMALYLGRWDLRNTDGHGIYCFKDRIEQIMRSGVHAVDNVHSIKIDHPEISPETITRDFTRFSELAFSYLRAQPKLRMNHLKTFAEQLKKLKAHDAGAYRSRLYHLQDRVRPYERFEPDVFC